MPQRSVNSATLDVETSKAIFESYMKVAKIGMVNDRTAEDGLILIEHVIRAFVPYVKRTCSHFPHAFIPSETFFESLRPVMRYLNYAPTKFSSGVRKMSAFPGLYPPFHITDWSIDHVQDINFFCEDLIEMEWACPTCGNPARDNILIPFAEHFPTRPILKMFTAFAVAQVCDGEPLGSSDAPKCIDRLVEILADKGEVHGALLYWIYFSLLFAMGNIAGRGYTGLSRKPLSNTSPTTTETATRRVELLRDCIDASATIFKKLASLTSEEERLTRLKNALCLKTEVKSKPGAEGDIEKKRVAFSALMRAKVTPTQRAIMLLLLSKPAAEEVDIRTCLTAFADRFK